MKNRFMALFVFAACLTANPAGALELIPVSSTETVAPSARDGGAIFGGRDPFAPVPATPKADEKKPAAFVMPKNYQPDIARLQFRGVTRFPKSVQAQLFDPVSGATYLAADGRLYDRKMKPLDGITAEVSDLTVTLAKGGKKAVLKLKKK